MSKLIDIKIYKENNIYPVKLETFLGENGEATICFKFENLEIVRSSDDFFNALQLIRLSLEKEHITILCNGSRKDVYPSGMARQMSNGKAAYIHILGQKQLDKKNLVKIFDYADLEHIGTVAEQNSFFEKWLAS